MSLWLGWLPKHPLYVFDIKFAFNLHLHLCKVRFVDLSDKTEPITRSANTQADVHFFIIYF